MRLKVPKKFGKRTYQFEVDGDNLHSVIMESEKLSFPNVEKCGMCGGENLRIRAYVTEKDKYEYVKVECWDCKASLTFGKKKNEKDVYFLRRNEDNSFKWEARPESKHSGAVEKAEDEVLPF